jgi:UDP-N-acetylglucosamine 4,6-dehydratase
MLLSDRTILIIGGTGTVGEALIEQLLKTDVHAIRIFARDEYRFFLLKQKYGNHPKLRYFIGDIKDKNRLNLAFTDCDIAINCAALKHISFCEESPFEALQVNVIGVQNALECAIENDIKMFVQISTDKVVNPCNMYAYTKALAEGLVLSAWQWQGKNKTKFTVVRSGNVKASSGSVIEIWRDQQNKGTPLTVTDLNAERYMASKEGIAKAIIQTVTEGLKGLVVLDMPCYKVSDILKEFDGCKVNITGLTKGEKLKEELWREGEIFTKLEVV